MDSVRGACATFALMLAVAMIPSTAGLDSCPQASRSLLQKSFASSVESEKGEAMQHLLRDFGHVLHNMSRPGDVDKNLQGKFEKIFRSNVWEDPESQSGSGSTVAATASIRDCLASWMQKHHVKLLLDIPCGDGNWQGLIPGIADGAIAYQGYDISSGAVEDAKKTNEPHKNMHFGVLDLVNQVPTEVADMIMVKEVIQHLPLEMGLKMLKNAKAAGIKWLAVTSNPLYHNVNVEPGSWFPGPNAQAAPFNFGAEYERCGVAGETGGANDFMLFDLQAWNPSS